jgi:hypothetical protein
MSGRRIDYTPGEAAEQALGQAEAMRQGWNTQAVLDWLVITAVSALQHAQWQPPPRPGRNRHSWRLPPAMRPDDVRKTAPRPPGNDANFPEHAPLPPRNEDHGPHG